jgi:hypothetical protein
VQTWDKDISEWEGRVVGGLGALARQSIQEVCDRVNMLTPRDQGILAGSWSVAIGAIPADAKQVKPDLDGSQFSRSVALVVTNLKLGQSVFCANSAAYALRVNYGFVGQDSLGRNYNQKGQFFLERGLSAWSSIVASTAAELSQK